MKILIIAGNVRSAVANRADLIEAMRTQGHQVQVVVPRQDWSSAIERLKVPHEVFQLSRTGLSPLSDLRSIGALVSIMRRAKPDLVFSYNAKPVIYGAIAARLAGVPRHYGMVTGLGYYRAGGGGLRLMLTRFAQERLYRVATALSRATIFQNRDDLETFRQNGLMSPSANAVVVNGSGINLERFPVQRLPAGSPAFVMISRLLASKGVEQFVAAAEQLQADGAKARFVLVGPHDPDLPGSLPVEMIENWRRRGVIEIVGGVDDVLPQLARASVFILPSFYGEGTPRAVLEAMSCGRAIITADAPGCRETVLEGVNGWLVPPRDVDSLARAMRRFVDDPSLIAAMGRESRRLAEERYDVHKVNRQMLDIMQLAGPHGS
ncbi:glycosyltransferase family 4 protein [Brevundimonas sp.]|uniref:glycosyltransferase family 4 protein n=1 Tax=Brevundimonas sp. TaxID=1871086 RepID=UPI002D715F7A|nr:glycosyltransferase family 4 protein [Brevundimonas sp.]HYD28103.1 glycosyltransferase family 4 protein [Brevundimonas sp.]